MPIPLRYFAKSEVEDADGVPAHRPACVGIEVEALVLRLERIDRSLYLLYDNPQAVSQEVAISNGRPTAAAARSDIRNILDVYIAIWQYGIMQMEVQNDHLSSVFSALADPTRRAILSRLASGDADVSELMKPFELHQSTISKHLGVLENAGLIMRKRDAQRRPRTLVAAQLKDVSDWLEPFRRLWEQRFARLDEHLKGMQKMEKARGRKKIRERKHQ